MSPAPCPCPPPPAPRLPDRPRVLVIEDHADSSQTLCLPLELWGCPVQAAGDGLRGVEKALAWRPDVVLCDIGLPGLDGYGVARRLREALGPGVLLVAVTGHCREQDHRRGLEAGFDHYLAKPAEVQEIACLRGVEVPA